MPGRVALVFVGGPGPQAPPASRLEGVAALDADLVVAVDSGLHLAQRVGRRADLVIGDLDSVSERSLELARHDGAEVRRFPTDKDATDLELALDAVAADGCTRTVLVGSAGGRIDHLLGGALTLCAPRHGDLGIEAWWGGALLVPVHRRCVLAAEPGTTVSLVAVNGAASEVWTDGLRWPLRGEQLVPGSSRGISNEFARPTAEVSVGHGSLIVIVPEEETRP